MSDDVEAPPSRITCPTCGGTAAAVSVTFTPERDTVMRYRCAECRQETERQGRKSPGLFDPKAPRRS